MGEGGCHRPPVIYSIIVLTKFQETKGVYMNNIPIVFILSISGIMLVVIGVKGIYKAIKKH